MYGITRFSLIALGIALVLGLALVGALNRPASVAASLRLTPTPSFVPFPPGVVPPFPTPPPPAPTTAEVVSLVGLGVIIGLILGGPLGIIIGLFLGRWRR